MPTGRLGPPRPPSCVGGCWTPAAACCRPRAGWCWPPARAPSGRQRARHPFLAGGIQQAVADQPRYRKGQHHEAGQQPHLHLGGGPVNQPTHTKHQQHRRHHCAGIGQCGTPELAKHHPVQRAQAGRPVPRQPGPVRAVKAAEDAAVIGRVHRPDGGGKQLPGGTALGLVQRGGIRRHSAVVKAGFGRAKGWPWLILA